MGWFYGKLALNSKIYLIFSASVGTQRALIDLLLIFLQQS